MKSSEIAMHMRDYGLHMLASGVLSCSFAEIGNPHGHAIGAVNCAIAAEIVLKSRIAEAHPLLIFSRLPPIDGAVQMSLLLEQGRTRSFEELPGLLRAVHGYEIPNLEWYRAFGKLRDQLVHFSYAPERMISEEALRFAFGVMEPAIREFWGDSIFNYTQYFFEAEDYDQGLREILERLGIAFVYPRQCELDQMET